MCAFYVRVCVAVQLCGFYTCQDFLALHDSLALFSFHFFFKRSFNLWMETAPPPPPPPPSPSLSPVAPPSLPPSSRAFNVLTKIKLQQIRNGISVPVDCASLDVSFYASVSESFHSSVSLFRNGSPCFGSLLFAGSARIPSIFDFWNVDQCQGIADSGTLHAKFHFTATMNVPKERKVKTRAS